MPFFPFPFFLSSFFLSLLSFSVFPFLLRLVLSFCRFPFVSCILYRLLRFSLRFPALLGGGFGFSVIVLLFSPRCYTPPALLASLEYAYSPYVLSPFLRSCFLLVLILFLFSSFPFFFDLDIVCFILSFSCGYYAIMLSPRFRFLLRLVQHMLLNLIRTYADLTFSFLSEAYDLFQLLCVISSASFNCFPSEVI